MARNTRFLARHQTADAVSISPGRERKEFSSSSLRPSAQLDKEGAHQLYAWFPFDSLLLQGRAQHVALES